MNFTWNHYYSVVKKVSSLAGQWPYQKPKTRLLCVSLVTLVTFSMIVPQMKVLIDQLFVEWDDLQTPEEFEIMKKYAEKGRRYSLGYSLYCFISVYLFMSVSLVPQLLDVVLPLNESRPILPAHPGYYFVDERKYFYYIFSHAIVAWEVAMTGIVAHDCMLLTYVEHVCSIFAISGFAQLIEDTFSLTLAIQITLNTVMISITLLQVTQENANYLIILRYIVYVVAQLIHLFCLSFEGQKLIDHSLQMRDTIYNCPWYKAPMKSQKMLLFVMRKSLQPIFLSAGKIYIFSLENFTT
ncbi:odorant receptor 22c, partial [Lasius niger]